MQSESILIIASGIASPLMTSAIVILRHRAAPIGTNNSPVTIPVVNIPQAIPAQHRHPIFSVFTGAVEAVVSMLGMDVMGQPAMAIPMCSIRIEAITIFRVSQPIPVDLRREAQIQNIPMMF